MSEMLIKVQVGPVQEFIAQARSTRDMWAGSYLLSWLTAAAMKVFKDADGVEFIFPTLENQPLYEMFCGSPADEGLIPTLPNVFMVLVPEKDVKSLTENAEKGLRNELEKIADSCLAKMKSLGAEGKLDWEDRWDKQVAAFPIFNWQAVTVSDNWKNDVEKLGREFAARRNTRNFEQWQGISGTVKDVLSGKEEIIGNEKFWDANKDFWNGAGPYGAMNCIKRLMPEVYLEQKAGSRKDFWKYMSTDSTRDIAAGNHDGTKGKDNNGEKKPVNPYMAVIAMDGDRMGVALQKIDSREAHTQFSKTLAEFAEKSAAPIVKEHKGQLVYAGGDDVLAMCPADNALNLAKALRDKFVELMRAYIDETDYEKLDASCGIAVGHYKFPLQRIVEEARKAEHRAKNKRGRAAFAVTLLKHSGEIVYWGAKWDSKALEVYEDFTRKVDDETFSGRFPYALAELLQPYSLKDAEESGINLKEIVVKEFLHVLERQSGGKVKEWKQALKYIEELGGDQLQDLPNLFLASAFMNRQRGEK